MNIFKVAIFMGGILPGLASANFVSDFESPLVGTTGDLYNEPAGNYSIYSNFAGWSPVGTQEIDITKAHGGLTSIGGSQFVDLSVNTGFNKGITTDISVTPNQLYSLSFQLASYNVGLNTFHSNVNASFSNGTLFGTLNPTSGLTSTNSIVPSSGSTSWLTYSLFWQAGSENSTKLTFLTVAPVPGSPGNYSDNALLDNVSLTAVPVPASLWLLASGLIGLLGLKNRKALV